MCIILYVLHELQLFKSMMTKYPCSVVVGWLRSTVGPGRRPFPVLRSA